VERGERVALVGVNGAGKSTLLRILAGVLPFERGERALGAHVTVHYYAQHQLDALDPARTVLEELTAVAPESGLTRLRTILGTFLFSGDDVDKRVGVLSGGEKARLALARMLARPATLLCLDEPTNHLDLASREVLEEALASFAGTIVFISHDRYFINRIATKVVEVAAGHLSTHLGDYDSYLAAKRAVALEAPRGARPRRPATPAPAAEPVEGRGGRRRGQQRSSRAVRELQRRLGEVEAQISALEARVRDLGEALTDPGLYTDGERVRALALERKRAEEQVAWLLREWEELSEAVAAHE
jgi:ATP-binding cassette subfamily F protein 3